MQPGEQTREEILSQPQAWAETIECVMTRADDLREFFHAGGYTAIFLTGCGSTFYLAMAAAEMFQQLLQVPTRGLPASEIWLSPRLPPPQERSLQIAFSRSGETTETLRACKHWREAGRDLLTLSCYPGAALSQLGSLNLLFPAGQEKSIVQTRAFTSLYLAATMIAMLWSGRDDLLKDVARLPDAGRRLLNGYKSKAREEASNSTLDRFYFLGSGPRYGLACELSLKLKEMSLSHCESFHFMEFRHGPKSMVTPTTLIVALVSQANRSPEQAVVDEMHSLGARVISIGESESDITFESGISEPARDVLYLPFGQLFALERALAFDLDPDRPRHLDAVVRLTQRNGSA